MKVIFEIKRELIKKLEVYLDGSLSHEDIQKEAWSYASQSPKAPSANESKFWEIVFSIIHLADEQHWRDGCTQRDLTVLCKELKKHIE